MPPQKARKSASLCRKSRCAGWSRIVRVGASAVICDYLLDDLVQVGGSPDDLLMDVEDDGATVFTGKLKSLVRVQSQQLGFVFQDRASRRVVGNAHGSGVQGSPGREVVGHEFV